MQVQPLNQPAAHSSLAHKLSAAQVAARHPGEIMQHHFNLSYARLKQ